MFYRGCDNLIVIFIVNYSLDSKATIVVLTFPANTVLANW